MTPILDSITVPCPQSFLTIAADVHEPEDAEVTIKAGVITSVVITNPVSGAVCTLVPEVRIPGQRRAGESS